ncbi:MAG: hypothetical protein RL339_942 [Pseudomonadota bacterium]
MSITIDQLVASPDAYFHSFEGEEAVFVPMDRAAYARSIFLDRRIQPAAEGVWRVPLAALPGRVPAAQPIRWIFHVAQCGSTLLANALEALSEDIVLREPFALRQLGLAPDPAGLDIALSLLSRRYPGGGATLIKANVPVNFILPVISAAQACAPAIFLYCELEDYLLAILRSANHRAWLRNATGLLAGHLGDLSALSDAELGAALWLAMRRRYVAALAQMPQSRSLDAERFFGAPQQVLEAAAGLFGLAADPDRIAAVVNGPLFATYSKNPAHAFDNAARLARRDALAVELQDDLAQARAWVSANGPDAMDIATRLEVARL